MAALNDHIREYSEQLRKGHIRSAYRGIMEIMSGLKVRMEGKCPDYRGGALYPGYMDMTYFAFTHPDLSDIKLKVAVVYLHEERRFEAWLAGANRDVRRACIIRLKGKDLLGYSLSQVGPGADSIITHCLEDNPDFDDREELVGAISEAVISFNRDMARLVL